MPNWCANRLRVTGPVEEVSKVKALMEGGAGAPGYVRAAGEGIQLFLAGCAGLLRPTAATEYAPYPALTVTAGSDTPENRAFTQWLELLRSGAELTPETCERLHELWLVSGLQRMTWVSLTGEQQTAISALWERKKGDWHWTISGQAVTDKWDGLCLEEALPLRTQPFDMLQLLPPRLDAEINGYNGRLLEGVPDGFTDTVDRCGTKWPHAHDLNLSYSGETVFNADFDTPWSPPSPEVMCALTARYGVTAEHWYAEAGCDYCGWATYSGGLQLDERCETLEWSEEADEDGYRDVTGPEWIIDNVASYGG
ncbi:MAG: DUF1281 domain-containing protein [Pantoea sp. Morm]|uniref:DUF1281 domain-containing protein n=1 Tax=Pantoea sp. Morm TaxID=2601250 RepID=UPI001DB4A12F|nr:DUF1281 domain-containing protein [Pantoea sp. Morm]